MKLLYTFLLVLFCLPSLLSQSIRQDWPVINGDPSRTSNANIDLTFPLEVTDTIAFNFGNEGGSVIWEDKVYFSTSSFDNMINAADLVTGDSLWTFTLPESTGSVQCTPAAAHGVVVAGGQNEKGLYGLNAYTGDSLWLAPVYGLYTRSPIIYDSLVYVSTFGGIVCFDLFSGDTIWAHDQPSPQITPAVDSQAVYYNAGGVIYARDRRTGEEIWSNASVSTGHSTNYVLDSTIVYVGHNDTISALIKDTGVVLWQTTLDSNEVVYYAGLAALTDSFLLAKTTVQGASENHYRLINKHNGSIMNSYTYGSYSWSAPTVVNGYVIDCGYSKLTFLDMVTGDSVYAVRGLQFGECPAQVIAVKDMIVIVGQFREIYILRSQTTGIRPDDLTFDVTLFPNPAHDEVELSVELTQASSFDVRLISLSGVVVQQEHIGLLTPGAHKLQIPVQAVPSGIYFVQLQSEEGQMTRKLIVE